MTKKDPNAYVTNEALDEAIESILKGMDNMLFEQKKIFATKEDLKREVSWLRNDVKDLTADLSDTPNRKEFNRLKIRV